MRRLLIASLVGRLPLGTCSLSVLLLVRACTHSFAVSGAAVGALALSQAVLAPVIGRQVDRLGAERVIVPLAVIQAAALVALVLISSGRPAHAVLVVMGVVIGASMPPIAASARALWPRLLADRTQRDAAFALDAAGQEVGWTLGPVLVGVVTGTISTRAAVLMVAAITLITAAWFTRAVLALSLTAAPRTAGARPRRMAQITRILLPITFLLGTSLGGMEVGIPALATRIASPSTSGLLLALWSIGSMAGGVVYGLRRWSTSRERTMSAMMALNGVLVIPLMVSHTLGLAAAGAFLSGIAFAPVLASLSSLIGDFAPAEAIAVAFTWNTAGLVSGVAAGSAVGGVIISLAGHETALACAGGMSVVSAILSFALLERRRHGLTRHVQGSAA